MNEPWGLYVHIPFCQARCTYCDFNTVTGMSADDQVRYVEALLGEWASETVPRGPLVSIFFGGGTPSIIDPSLIGRIIERVVQDVKTLDPSPEITLEANPGTVSTEKLQGWLQAGVNRLSIGAQARQNHHLTALNRVHDVRAIDETVALARQAGFDNISLDAIYGLPNQTFDEWRETVEGLVQLEPEHLSLYSLIIEEGTPLAKSLSRGAISLPPEDLVAEMADWAQRRLSASGLEAYEISNYARVGYESRHNRLYWRLNPYLALGAGAHAYVGGQRWWNVRGVRRYMTMVEQGQDPTDASEVLSLDEEMREFLWLGLRETEGISKARFQRRFGLLPDEAFASLWGELSSLGLLAVADEAIRLTVRGRDMANYVARALVDRIPDVKPSRKSTTYLPPLAKK